MKKTNVIVSGCTGRVGQELIQLLNLNSKTDFIFGFGSKTKSAEVIAKFKSAPANTVVIDFSTPQGLSRTTNLCLNYKIPLVSGTTGLTSKQHKELKSLSKKVPVLWSPNMSRGVNLFLKMISALGQQLETYDLMLEDKHHIRKKDSPSGTAKLIAQAVREQVKTKAMPIESTRGGGIIGIHKLWLMGEEETLTIEHTATNRAVFARGAIDAAIWLQNKSPKVYSFQDFLIGK